MARGKHRLPSTFLKAADFQKPGRFADGGGLYLQVATTKDGSLTRSWLFRFTLHGKARQMGLGPAVAGSLAKAREDAQEASGQVRAGIDPIEHRKAERAKAQAEAEAAKTFKVCAREYLKAHGNSWRNDKHRRQWETTLETYAYPIIGNMDVAEIGRAEVTKVLKPIWQTKNVTASRLRGRIAKILGWARYMDYRTGDNPADWKDNLEHDLPKKSQVHIPEHFAALPYQDIGQFMADLRGVDAVSARCLEFLILTTSRTGEAIGATWDEIDHKRKLWSLPPERMKTKVAHNVPLSDDALAIIDAMPEVDGNPYIFPGHKEGKPLSNMALLQLLKRMNLDVTAHGFRSTFRDWSAERTAFPRMVPELCLAHGPQDKTEAAYLRASLMDQRRQLLEQWATYCGTVAGEQGNVTPIRGA